MSTTRKLIHAADELGMAAHLVEAAVMATAALPSEHRSAMAAVLVMAQEHLEEGRDTIGAALDRRRERSRTAATDTDGVAA